jgi:hypothetical protein
MRFAFAEQYNIVCVVIDAGDTAAEVIAAAIKNSATYFDGEDECYCVQFPDRPQELYTDVALRRSNFPSASSELGEAD